MTQDQELSQAFSEHIRELIQFDETLRQIEEREFYDKIWKIRMELLNDLIED